MKVARRQKKKASYNMLIRLRFFWRHEGRTAPIFQIRQSTPGLKVILFRRYITSIKMTFDPGVGVPPTGAAASLAPRFLTVSRFYWSQRNVPGLFPISREQTRNVAVVYVPSPDLAPMNLVSVCGVEDLVDNLLQSNQVRPPLSRPVHAAPLL